MSLFKFRHSVFWPYFYKVYQHKRNFEEMVAKAEAAPSLEKRMELAQEAISYALLKPTGYYASPALEKIFLEAASEIPDVKCTPIDKTVLHVITRALSSGGHTRVAQRWINLSKVEERHDIVLLEQEQEPIPQWLKESAEAHHGTIIQFEKMDIMSRAFQLRKLATKYQRIILHVNMDDPTAIIAFGTETFTTPIIFFNHADHLFWVGVSIADIVADLRCDHISYSRRAVAKSYNLGIPCAPMQSSEKYDKATIRKELGIPLDDFVLVTTGSAYKYKPLGRNSLCKQLVEVVKREGNVSCYAIGPSKDGVWEDAYNESNGKVHPLGVLKEKKLYTKYLQAADLYVGSYPYRGYTSTMDAVQCGLPYVQLLMSRSITKFLVLNQEFDQSRCLCHTTRELVDKIIRVKHNTEERDALWQTSKQWADLYMQPDAWQQRLYDMYDQCPKQHHIHTFELVQGKHVMIDDNMCIIGLLIEKDTFEFENRILRLLARMWMRIMGV